MNIAESMVFVLKNRSGDLFQSFFKDDLKGIFRDIKKDVTDFIKSGKGKVTTIKKQSFKETLLDVKDSTVDSVTVFKVIPSRIRQGYLYFQNDLLNEMDKLEDQKDKTLFCLKVIGVLSSFTLSTLYGVKRAKSDLQFKGLRVRNAFTHMLATELLVRISQVFTLRLMNEIEKQMEDQDELRKLNYFKSLLNDADLSKVDQSTIEEVESGDKAYTIVESFKTYVLTGKRVEP